MYNDAMNPNSEVYRGRGGFSRAGNAVYRFGVTSSKFIKTTIGATNELFSGPQGTRVAKSMGGSIGGAGLGVVLQSGTKEAMKALAVSKAKGGAKNCKQTPQGMDSKTLDSGLITWDEIKIIQDVGFGVPKFTCGKEILIEVPDQKCKTTVFARLTNENGNISMQGSFDPTDNTKKEPGIMITLDSKDLGLNGVKSDDMDFNRAVPGQAGMTDALARANPVSFYKNNTAIENRCAFLKSGDKTVSPNYRKIAAAGEIALIAKFYAMNAVDSCGGFGTTGSGETPAGVEVRK